MLKIATVAASLFGLFVFAQGQTLDQIPQVEDGMGVSQALDFSPGVVSPYLPVSTFNTNCYNIRKGFPSGFWIGLVDGPGFQLVPCTQTSSLKCWKRIACKQGCLVVKSCLDTTGLNRCLRAFQCPKPCDTFSYTYENSDYGVQLVSSPNGGFIEEKCTTLEGTTCLRAVDCVPSATGVPANCMSYQHCADPTGGKKCLRQVSCFCEGKYKFIAVDVGVKVVDSDQGYSIRVCKNGCFDVQPCFGGKCKRLETCVSDAGTKGCLRVVPCDYVPPPDPCDPQGSLQSYKSPKGIEYVPVDGPGVSLIPCPPDAAGNQGCYRVIDCQGPSADGQPCMKRIDCASADGTASCIVELHCGETTTTTTTPTTTTPTTTTTTAPCSSGANLMSIPSSKGVKLVAAADGFTIVKCPNYQNCYEKVPCTSVTGALSCQNTKSCKSATGTSCSLEVPCCPKGIQRIKASKGYMFVETLENIPGTPVVQFTSCGNPKCEFMEDCKWGTNSKCFAMRPCPDPNYPNQICQRTVGCASDCIGAIKLTNPTDITQAGIALMTQDNGVQGYFLTPCPHVASCFTRTPCKFNSALKVQTCYEDVKCDLTIAATNNCKIPSSCNT